MSVTGYAQIVFGTQALDLKNLTRNKVQGTIKQKVGGKLIKHPIPGRDVRDWKISANGIIITTSTAATTARVALEGLDDLTPHAYSDGLITGTYIVESLKFDDRGDTPLHFSYSISLIEFNQVTS